LITAVTLIGGMGTESLFTDSTSMRVWSARCAMPSCATPPYEPLAVETVAFTCA